MNEHDIEQALEEELEKLSENLCGMGSDSDSDIEEDFTVSAEKVCVCVFVCFFATCSYNMYCTTVYCTLCSLNLFVHFYETDKLAAVGFN